ncbi:transposase family protein [Nesterenkonia sphaerica]|uniref:Transposase family protein n=1 Tax=Nesterenkonia sphaerica TaxID=1804988 RepID=A0A5R8ZZ39_9MICC|nr:transposase family protein [Nesterenkonia sphaerica]
MPKPAFVSPDLDSFCLLDGLGLTVTGQHIRRDRAILECGVTVDDPWCRSCRGRGIPRGTVVRRLAHLPLGWRPTTLWVRVLRYRCSDCARVWRQDTSKAADRGRPGAVGPWAPASG